MALTVPCLIGRLAGWDQHVGQGRPRSRKVQPTLSQIIGAQQLETSSLLAQTASTLI